MSDSFKKNPQQKNKILFRLLCVLLGIVFLALVVLGGYALYYYQSPSAYTLRWVKDMVQTYYYQEIPKDVFSAAELDDFFGYNGKQKILDAYSAYYTPEEYQLRQSQQAGNQNGIGLTFLAGQPFYQIYKVNGNSPAEESGLKAGMYVFGYGISEEDIEEYDNQAFSSFLNGLKEGEQFVLCAAEEENDTGEYYTLYKSSYAQNYAFYEDCHYSYRFTGNNASVLTQGEPSFNFLPEDTAYIRLDSFNGKAATQTENLLQVFKNQGKKRLVLDLRNNGGGQVSVLCQLARLFCKEESGKNFPVLTVQYKTKGEVYYANENCYETYFSEDTEIIVLANENSASASECLLGAMLDYQTITYEDVFLAEINGTAKTYGKGIMQTTYSNFFTGEAVKLTTATVHWPVSQTCIQGRGILPQDGAVAVPTNGYVSCQDDMFRAVVETYFA